MDQPERVNDPGHPAKDAEQQVEPNLATATVQHERDGGGEEQGKNGQDGCKPQGERKSVRRPLKVGCEDGTAPSEIPSDMMVRGVGCRVGTTLGRLSFEASERTRRRRDGGIAAGLHTSVCSALSNSGGGTGHQHHRA